MLPGTGEVFRVGEACGLPVRPEALARGCCDGSRGQVWRRLDGKVGVA